MDPLSALAIAAAAFQFLDLGGKLCVKGWEKYKQIQQAIPDDQKLAEEEEELRKIFEELSGQISWFRQVSTSIVVSQPPTSTQVQLLKLSSQCTSLSSDFESIESQMKPPNSMQMKSEIHKNEHVGGMFRRQIQEKDCKECRKKREEEEHEFQRSKENIESLKEKMDPLKREITDFIFLSLWDDSKRTKQWELHFSNQMDKLIELLESAGKIPMNNSQKLVLLDQMTPAQIENLEDLMQQSDENISIMADEETVGLRNALQPLIQPGNGPVSLKQLANDMMDHLKMESGSINTIRREMINILWKNDWKLDASMASAKIDSTMVAQEIATGIQFNNIQTREETISKNFEATYSWIFLDEPPMKDDIPIWNSFPKWLQDDSRKVYWITGKPGSGKSTMMKLILQEPSVRDTLSQSLGPLQLLLVKYYAWLPGNALQKSIEGLKRTVLYQALKQYPDLAPILAPRRWAFCQVLRSFSGLPTWHTWEIEESFEALLSLCGKTIKLVLFVDGLDEFDTPAGEVIKCIQHITAMGNTALKICAASRPWTEFQDEFNQGPMLQMHLLTENDMNTFISDNFKKNKGFVEQRQLNPEAASQLLTDIVQRANGVFLWVSIVVSHLSSCFSEGQSISQARKVLEALPTRLSSLYDTIWAGIHPNNLPNASYMIQVLRAYDGPMPWLTLWVIEESRFSPERVVLPANRQLKGVAFRSLTRKLAACTKCFLELGGNENHGFVDFVHRTARDWALQTENWHLICSSSDEQFDPHLCILKAETLISTDKEFRLDLAGSARWKMIVRILWHAGEAKDIPRNMRDINHCLHLLKRSLQQSPHGAVTSQIYVGRGRSRPEGIETYGDVSPLTIPVRLHFLALAAQFSILSYIRSEATQDRAQLSPSFFKGSIGLLESAILGYSYFVESSPGDFCPQIPRDRRLATVQFLLDQGVRQAGHNLRGLLAAVSPADPEYYSTVATYLNETDFMSSIRSMELRARSLIPKSQAKFWDATMFR